MTCLINQWENAKCRQNNGVPAHLWFDRRLASYGEAMGTPPGVRIPEGLGTDVLDAALESTPLSRKRHLFLRFGGSESSYSSYGELLERIQTQLRSFSETQWAIEGPISTVQISLPHLSEEAYQATSKVIQQALKTYLCTTDTLVSVELELPMLSDSVLNDLKAWRTTRLILTIGSFKEHWHQQADTGLSAREALNAIHFASGFEFPLLQAHLTYGHPGWHNFTTPHDMRLAKYHGCNALSWWTSSRNSSGCHRAQCCMKSLHSNFESIQEWLEVNDWQTHRVWQSFDTSAFDQYAALFPGVEDDLLSMGALTAGRIGDVAYFNVSEREAAGFRHPTHHPAGPVLAFRIQSAQAEVLQMTKLTTEGRCPEEEIANPHCQQVLASFEDLGLAEHDGENAYRLTPEGKYWAHNMTEYVSTIASKQMP